MVQGWVILARDAHLGHWLAHWDGGSELERSAEGIRSQVDDRRGADSRHPRPLVQGPPNNSPEALNYHIARRSGVHAARVHRNPNTKDRGISPARAVAGVIVLFGNPNRPLSSITNWLLLPDSLH